MTMPDEAPSAPTLAVTYTSPDHTESFTGTLPPDTFAPTQTSAEREKAQVDGLRILLKKAQDQVNELLTKRMEVEKAAGGDSSVGNGGEDDDDEGGEEEEEAEEES